MQIITAAVIKGGTAKTSTFAALAQAAANAGKRVLAIDLDPQANLTNAIGADRNSPGSYALLNGTPAAQLIQTTEQGIYTIAASADLATVKTTPASAKRLQRALEPLQGHFDLAVIDVPPMLGELLYNALQASAGLIGAVDKVCFQKYGLAKSLSNSIYLIVNNNKQARKTYLLFR